MALKRRAASLHLMQIDSLKGLPGVEIVVEDLREDAERNGLTKTGIQTDVERKLQLAGVRVLTAEESNQTPSAPALHVSVNTTQPDDGGLYAYGIQLELMQLMRSLVPPEAMVTGVTWDAGAVGSISATNLRDVLNSVRDLVDEFINDWLTANPK